MCFVSQGANIMIVGTHADLVSQEDTEKIVDSIMTRMHNEERAKLNVRLVVVASRSFYVDHVFRK